jgi:hypothetical protein
MSYSRIIKEAALEKMFNTGLPLRYISDQLSIPRATLHLEETVFIGNQ